MSKPLTIDELKALNVGDWVWVFRDLDTETPCSHYGEIESYGTVSLTHSHEYLFVRNRGVHNLKYADYGKTWLAYKNKEIYEECKSNGEIC